MMLHVLPMIRRLPGLFGNLNASLLAWKDAGDGLWPLRGWHEESLTAYLAELYEATQQQLASQLQRDVLLPAWRVNGPGEVTSGPDLLLMISLIIATFTHPGLPDRSRLDPNAIKLLEQLERIQWALIGLVYPEEPGELTVEQVLQGT